MRKKNNSLDEVGDQKDKDHEPAEVVVVIGTETDCACYELGRVDVVGEVEIAEMRGRGCENGSHCGFSHGNLELGVKFEVAGGQQPGIEQFHFIVDVTVLVKIKGVICVEDNGLEVVSPLVAEDDQVDERAACLKNRYICGRNQVEADIVKFAVNVPQGMGQH